HLYLGNNLLDLLSLFRSGKSSDIRDHRQRFSRCQRGIDLGTLYQDPTELKAFFLLRCTSIPLIRAFPSDALIISVKILSVVVFPAPFGPKKPTHFEPSIFKERFDKARNEP